MSREADKENNICNEVCQSVFFGELKLFFESKAFEKHEMCFAHRVNFYKRKVRSMTEFFNLQENEKIVQEIKPMESLKWYFFFGRHCFTLLLS